MTTVSQQNQNLIKKYETLYNQINIYENPNRVFPGSSQFVLDYGNISEATQADLFFAKYGVGNVTAGSHIPFERKIAYELLLEILISLDPVQYHSIHKGSPYYFIGWTAYQYHDFAQSIFYMDAAVSEDLKFPDVQAKTAVRPSLEFFLLKSTSLPSGLAVHLDIKNVITETLQDYMNNGGGTITIVDFCDKFVADLLYNGIEGRSLLTSLYTFLMEYQEKKKQILLRSNTGGSIQSFLDHLFDGARILESLLEKRGGGSGTLHQKLLEHLH